MSLKPFYMLNGKIDKIKVVDYADENMRETTYEDEDGNRAIINTKIEKEVK